jgi:nicotinamide-nucleotide amidase
VNPERGGEGGAPGPHAVLVTIGDELLSGERQDRNGPWMAAFLGGRGIPVREILAVGDGEDEIVEALARALLRAPLVLVTGGLGPTRDDRTREAVARLLSLPLREDEGLLRRLEARYRDQGLPGMPERARRMTVVPEGAEILANGKGSAPGLALRAGGRRLVLLPGIPGEMRALVEEEVAPRLDAWFPGRPAAPASTLVRTSGIAESLLAQALEEALAGEAGEDALAGEEGRAREGVGDAPPVAIAYRPSLQGVELRFSAAGPGADAALARALERVEPVLRPYRYDAPSGDLAEVVLQRCAGRKWRLAVAESCTGGLLAARLTGIPGSSAVFLGGVVAYHDQVKSDLLEVPPEMIRAHGAVSEEVVVAMARGAARRLGAHLTLSVSGVAGPGGGTPEKPVGLVWFGLHGPDGDRSFRARFPGDRAEVRARSVQFALERLAEASNPPPGNG